MSTNPLQCTLKWIPNSPRTLKVTLTVFCHLYLCAAESVQVQFKVIRTNYHRAISKTTRLLSFCSSQSRKWPDTDKTWRRGKQRLQVKRLRWHRWMRKCGVCMHKRVHAARAHLKTAEGRQRNMNPCLLLLSKLCSIRRSEPCCGGEPVVFDLGAWCCHRHCWAQWRHRHRHTHTDRHTQPRQRETREEQLWVALISSDWGRHRQAGKQTQMYGAEQNREWEKEEGHPFTMGR